jgi:tetratricopeptide (TPR) repeat protein
MSFGGGGMGRSFGGGGSMSRGFSGGNPGGSISHSFSGGSSHNFSPQSSSHNFSTSPWNGSHSHDMGNQSWAHNPHGQSTWQRERSSSTWQFERSQSSWQQHLSDWKNGEHWHNGNWNNNWWGHNGNWNNSWWGHNGSWSSANWWGRNNWWGHSNWWNHSGFCYYPAIGIGAAFWFPWWCDSYYPAYDYYASYDYVTPYYLSSALYSPASTVISEPLVAQAQYVDPPTMTAQAQPAGESDAGADYFAQASAAFRSAQYKDALRLANHAAVESPQNPKAHEMMSLALFASGDYRGAAAEAHAALAFGPPADWATLYGYYGDDALYTTQLRALEKYSHDNATAADARFVRAYQYLMMGHQAQAIDQLQEVAKLTPSDRLVADLLKKFSESPTDTSPTPPTPVPAKPLPPQRGLRPVDNGGVDS